MNDIDRFGASFNLFVRLGAQKHRIQVISTLVPGSNLGVFLYLALTLSEHGKISQLVSRILNGATLHQSLASVGG